jgi:hypothetical protein
MGNILGNIGGFPQVSLDGCSDGILKWITTSTELIIRNLTPFQGHVICSKGRAIIQAVSRMLPTAATRVRAQFRPFVICDGQSGTGSRFFFLIFAVGLWVLWPLLAYCTSPG